MHRLLRGAALPVDGGRRNLDGKAREQHRLAGDVHRLLAGLHHAPEDDVVDESRLDTGAAGDLTENVRGELDRMDVAKITVLEVAAAQRRAHRLHDDDVDHALTPLSRDPGRLVRGAWVNHSSEGCSDRSS